MEFQDEAIWEEGFWEYRGQITSFNNDIFATRGTPCLDFILVCFHQPPSAPSIFCFLTDLAWLTIYRGRCRGSVKTQVGLSTLWRRNFAHNDCPRYSTIHYKIQQIHIFMYKTIYVCLTSAWSYKFTFRTFQPSKYLHKICWKIKNWKSYL